MKIEMIGWECSGLRCPNIKIDLLKNGNVPRVSLIQMPNGTGKTTTLTMLRAALSGEASRWDEKTITGFRRPGESEKKGFFAVHLRIDGTPLTFTLNVNYEEKSIRYSTTYPGAGGIKKGWNPPIEVKRFLDKRFINLFIFDGELAERLLNSRESEASNAIDALCQLYIMEDMKQIADEEWQKATKNAGAKTDKGLTRAQNEVDKLKKKIAEVSKAFAKAQEKTGKLASEVEKLEKSIRDNITTKKELRDEYDEKRLEEEKCRALVEQSAGELMNEIRRPHLLDEAFANSLIELKSNLDKLKLPSSTSKQFFDELLLEDECICGRPMDEQAVKEIRKRSEKFLAEEIAGVLNAMKQDIANEKDYDRDSMTNRQNDLNKAVRAYQLAQGAARALHQKLIEEGDEQLKQWEKELQEKKEEKAKLDELIKAIQADEDGVDDDSVSLSALKQALKAAEKKLSEISGTIDLKKRTDILKNILDLALVKARHRLNQIILKECNNRLTKVLSQDPVYVEKIGKSLTLLNQDGASAGQTLAVGYIFLTTLLNRGLHKFPLIVDSPAHNLSIKVRREIGGVVPELCEQFVTFTTSSERTGFVQAIEKAASEDVKYLTLFRKTSGTEYLMGGLPELGVTQNESAVLVEGKPYFDQFDVEEEKEG